MKKTTTPRPMVLSATETALNSLSGTAKHNWMSISEDIVESLSGDHARELLKFALTNRGQSEHEVFYQGLKRVLGDKSAAELVVDVAKNKTK